MKTWGYSGYIFFLVIIGIVVKWFQDGQQVYTKTAMQKEVIDELFGTTTIEWEEGFWLGLDYAGPIAGVSLVLGVGIIWLANKMNKTT